MRYRSLPKTSAKFAAKSTSTEMSVLRDRNKFGWRWKVVLKVAFDKNKLTVLETFELNDVSKLSCAVEDEGVWAAGRNGFVYHIDKTVSSERIGQNLEVREIKPIGGKSVVARSKDEFSNRSSIGLSDAEQ
ncbi:MAG: hypothetical protein IPJ30_28105 [Acidobacteria bacterium]|nr:hypothetical protein [Acidobacteriota bacterium]